MEGPIVIVGGGLAAISCARALRTAGYRGELTVVAGEAECYDRPPLSKTFQLDGDAAKIRLRPPEATWLPATRARAIDPPGGSVELGDGRRLPYARLVIATGALPRTLPALEGAPFPVLALRTLEDASRIRESLGAKPDVLVVGGGVIGLELAATARRLGARVTLVEAAPRLMSRNAPPAVSERLAAEHRKMGVDLRLGTTIDCRGGKVALGDGTLWTGDLALVGIGVRADDALARAAGIACDDGIFVDGYGRTTCPGVYAVGDVARQRNPLSGRFERIETWSNARDQAAAVGRAMVDPAAPAYAQAPWYWTEQYELNVQVAGLSTADECLVRGDPAGPSFSLLQMAGGRLVGAACVNNAREFGALRRQIAQSLQ